MAASSKRDNFDIIHMMCNFRVLGSVCTFHCLLYQCVDPGFLGSIAFSSLYLLIKVLLSSDVSFIHPKCKFEGFG